MRVVSRAVSDDFQWLEVTLDSGGRRGIAEAVEATAGDDRSQDVTHLLRMLRGPRDELLFDEAQARLVLTALSRDKRMSALRARLEAFLGLR